MAFDTLLIMGRPGSGKGTQSRVLANERGWLWLSSGAAFKTLRDGTSPLGARVRTFYDQGKLMPNWFAEYLLEENLLNLEDGKVVVLDGFGRTEEQAKHLIEILKWLGRSLVVLNLEVREEEALKRMMLRGKTEDRPDSDGTEKIKARFDEYTANTTPALEYFRQQGVVTEIDGEQSPEDVSAAIKSALNLV